MILLGISHCSLRFPNRVCNIGWAENAPVALLYALMQPWELAPEWYERLLWYAHEYLDELHADWLVYNEESPKQRRNMPNEDWQHSLEVNHGDVRCATIYVWAWISTLKHNVCYCCVVLSHVKLSEGRNRPLYYLWPPRSHESCC